MALVTLDDGKANVIGPPMIVAGIEEEETRHGS